MKLQVSAIATSTARRSQRRAPSPTASSNARTAMWTLARYTAAPPRKEKTIISRTEAGSGQEAGLFTTYRMKTPYGMMSVMTTRLTPEITMQATYSASMACAYRALTPMSGAADGSAGGASRRLRTDHRVSSIRLISAAHLAPYLSRTGFVASYKGRLSTSTNSTPA